VEPNFVGVDVVELARMLARALPNDRLLMNVTDSEMELQLEGEFSRSFALPLIDVSEEEKEIKIPDAKFDARIEINARLLKEALKDAHIFGSSVTLRVKNKQFHIEAKGSQGTLRTVSKEGKLISVKHGVDVTSKYSLNYLSNVIKEADNDSTIVLELRSDAPLRVSYEIGKTKLQYYLAHMIL
jgi:proliferating cell nuclear antigen